MYTQVPLWIMIVFNIHIIVNYDIDIHILANYDIDIHIIVNYDMYCIFTLL